MGRNHRTDSRGVSEVLGFILVFSLIVGTVSMVYVSGFSELDAARDSERINNAERAFDVLANNHQQLVRGNAPRGATEIKLSEAQLEFGTERTVSVNGSASAETIVTPIVYSASGSDTEIVYEGGAVIRSQPDGAVMLREPDFLIQDNGVVRFISTRPEAGSPTSISGDTTVLVRSRVSDEALLRASIDEVDTVTFETAPDRAPAWVRYFEDRLEGRLDSADGCDHDDGVVTCELEAGEELEEVSVARTAIRVELS